MTSDPAAEALGHPAPAQPLRIRIFSDLHLEGCAYTPEPAEADVVVLAGDIDKGTAGMQWGARYFPHTPVIYVAGNHEFYRGDMPEIRRRFETEALRLGVHYLENSEVIIGGVRFLGATLWTDFRLYDNPAAAMVEAMRMNDFHIILDGDDVLTPARTVEFHAESLASLTEQLAIPFPGKTVVVTHHAPSQRSIAPHFQGDALSAGFTSKLDHLFPQVDLWIHGHTHYSCQYQAGRCRVVSNQRGYVRRGGAEDTGFVDPFIVTL